MEAAEIQRRARQRLKSIERARKDPRYRRVLGRLVADGLLTTNEDVPPHHDPIAVMDVLWAGRVEPRFWELLPALLVKQPSLFVDPTHLPAELDAVVRRLRRNLEPPPFHGIPGHRLYRWLSEVGPRKGVPARLKSFRLRPDDLRLLSALAAKLGVSETEIVRRGLRALL